jgi:hypothetical protein
VSGPLLPTRFRRIAALSLVGLLAAGCGAGFNAASLDVRPNSGAAQDGSLKINNVWVVVDPGTGNAEVLGAVANTGSAADRLVSAAANGLRATVRPASPAAGAAPQEQAATVAGGEVTIEGGSSVSFGQPQQPQLALAAGPGFLPGNLARVSLDFAAAGPVTTTAEIVSNTSLFAQYDPNGSTVTGTASASPSPSS